MTVKGYRGAAQRWAARVWRLRRKMPHRGGRALWLAKQRRER
jgi:hypothetical protein